MSGCKVTVYVESNGVGGFALAEVRRLLNPDRYEVKGILMRRGGGFVTDDGAAVPVSGERVSRESAASVIAFQRELVLVHVRALRRSAARLPWWRRPAFWARVWRETS